MKQRADFVASGPSLQLVWILLCGILLSSCASEEPPTKTEPAPQVLRVPADYATIQEALDGASDGDTVLIAPGDYRGPGNVDLKLERKGIALIGAAGAESTVIDCDGPAELHSGISVYGSGDRMVVIRGLTVTHAVTPLAEGAAVYCQGANVHMEDCILVANESLQGGGAYVLQSRVRFWRCQFTGNGAEKVGSALCIVDSHASVLSCAFRGNFSEEGAAVYVARSVLYSLESSVLEGNIGGALLVSGANVDVLRTLVVHNVALGRGGGFHVEEQSVLTVQGSTVADNASGFEGGGIWVSAGCSVYLVQSVIWGNCAQCGGEDILLSRGAGALVHCSAYDTTRCSFEGSVAYLDSQVYQDPHFCESTGCGESSGGDYRLQPDSPCLPANNPCHFLIGGQGMGCGAGDVEAER